MRKKQCSGVCPANLKFAGGQNDSKIGHFFASFYFGVLQVLHICVEISFKEIEFEKFRFPLHSRNPLPPAFKTQLKCRISIILTATPFFHPITSSQNSLCPQSTALEMMFERKLKKVENNWKQVFMGVLREFHISFCFQNKIFLTAQLQVMFTDWSASLIFHHNLL